MKWYQTVSTVMSTHLQVSARLPLENSKEFDMGGGGLYKNLSRKSKYGHNRPKIVWFT